MIKTKDNSGFTLIELLISVSIIVIITGVVLANHNRFNSTIFLGNLAYDIALSIREAQIFGLSVKEFKSSFKLGYGVHFDLADNKSFILFADLDRDQLYDDPLTGGTDEVVEKLNITRGNKISLICATPVGGVSACSGNNGPTKLDISFLRPNPEAVIKNPDLPGIQYERARIVVSSVDGDTREVLVESTGQISVQNP